jgi:hypothetical protein
MSEVKNRYDMSKRIFATTEQAAVFYANQAKRLEGDPSAAEVFQASCETAEMLLRLMTLETESQ